MIEPHIKLSFKIRKFKIRSLILLLSLFIVMLLWQTRLCTQSTRCSPSLLEALEVDSVTTNLHSWSLVELNLVHTDAADSIIESPRWGILVKWLFLLTKSLSEGLLLQFNRTLRLWLLLLCRKDARFLDLQVVLEGPFLVTLYFKDLVQLRLDHLLRAY